MVEREYADALPHGAVRGRGAGINPGNRFDGVRLHVLGETLDEAQAAHPEGRQVATHALADRTRRIINRVDSPDLGFHWTINPYRGCEHGCVYCYARPTHEMLGFSSGLDFETQIVAKPDAAALLRRELAAPSWRGEPIVMSGVTDPYQPVESGLRITRECLEVMARWRQPVSIVTKSRMVVRDCDLLSDLKRHDAVHVALSLTTLDPELARIMEPRASRPSDRLRAIQELSDAGIPVGVMIAPIIPGLNDREVPALLAAASSAGARSATWVLLRLPYQVKSIFEEWLRRCLPLRANHVLQSIRSVRDGALSDAKFGRRMRGEGVMADQIATVFDVFRRKLKLDAPLPPLSSAAFRPPDGQLGLF